MQQIYETNAVLGVEAGAFKQTVSDGNDRPTLDRLVQAGVVTSRPQIVGGAYVFAGTRVPVYNLWDYLEAGDSLEVFLDSFPTVPRALAEKAIEVVQENTSTKAFFR